MAARTPFQRLLATTAAPDQPVTFEALGEQLLTALPSLPLYSLSLHNDRAQVLWINEGELGPAEQSFSEEALQVLGAEPEQPSYENILQDGRAASILPVRTPRGDLLGLVLIVHAPTGETLDQLMTPQLRTILRKLGVLMRPSIAGAAEPAPRSRVQRARNAPVPQEPPVPQAPPVRQATPVPQAPPAAPSARQADRRPTAAPEPAYEEPVYEEPQYPEGPEGYAPQEAYPQEEDYAPDAQEQQYAEEAYAPEAQVPADEEEAYAGQYEEGYAEEAPAPEPEPEPQPEPPQRRPLRREMTPAAPTRAPSRAPLRGAAPRPSAPRPSAPRPSAPRPSAPRPSAPRARVAAAPRVPSAGRAAQEAAGRVPPGYRRVPQQSRPPMGRGQANRGGGYSTQGVQGAPGPQAAEAPMRASAAGRRLAETIQARQGTRPARPAVIEPRVILELLPFVNLRQGARGRRFELLPHAIGGESADGLDTRAVQELISWLGTNRGLWSLEPTSFTINLSITTLEDERFLPQAAQALQTHGIQAETLGFEIAEALYTQNRALVERFVSLCDKTGCFLAIDDFSFDPAVLSLLRSRAVRLVKVDAKLTSALQRDKLSEALVTAIIQATRVLGVQCAAKAVESQSLLQWLTAAGCDVAQGPALSGPQPLEALGSLG